MDEVGDTLEYLCGITDEKVGALERILAITENQESVYGAGRAWAGKGPDEGGPGDVSRILSEMNGEKQKLIHEVLRLDQLFNEKFARIGDGFEEKVSGAKPLVASLQLKIAAAMALDERIRRQENGNAAISGMQPAEGPAMPTGELRRPQKSSPRRVLDQYKKNAKKDGKS